MAYSNTLWIREMGGGHAAKCITRVGRRLKECNISKHIMSERRWHALNTALMESGERERGGSREFLFYFGEVCVLCLPIEC